MLAHQAAVLERHPVVFGELQVGNAVGHFGRAPIRLGWFALVLPSLALNYFGQGALLLTDPTAHENPFFHLAPDWFHLPLVAFATAGFAAIMVWMYWTSLTILIGAQVGRSTRDVLINERGREMVEGDL